MNINVNKIKKVHSTDSDSTEGYIQSMYPFSYESTY